MNNRVYGQNGEDIAREWLIKEGLIMLESNFHAGKLGEIDLIAEDGDVLCFIEVKRRSQTRYGTPAEAVTWKKQQTIRKIAQCYLMRINGWQRKLRFDVIEVYSVDDDDTVRHLKGAF